MQITRFFFAQVSSLAGGAVDYGITIVAVEAFQFHYLLAIMLGSLAGGGLNFYLGRHYVFGGARQALPAQAYRYLLVWLGGLLLNGAGIYLLVQGLAQPYLVSKVLINLLVGVGFNYVLQQRFVFKES